MSRIITYLTFNGNCKEAMTFYQNCLGGSLKIQTIADSAMSGEMPENMGKFILEAALHKGTMVIKGTDLADEPLSQGNKVTILLECEDAVELTEYYKKLSASGEETYPVAGNYFGGHCGMLKDKFGFQWLLRSDD